MIPVQYMNMIFHSTDRKWTTSAVVSVDSHPSSKDMSPVQKSNTEETPNEDLLKYQSILKSNGIHDEVSKVVVKHSGLQGAGMGSQHLYVTVKFTDPNIQPLNLFVKAHTGNPSHSEMIDAVKGFENETRFFTEYIPAAKEFCKSKGSDGLVDFYPKCYYGDENMVVFENLVLDRGFTLLSAEEKQDMEAVSFAIDHLAKHHAISYALINEFGGPGPFFTRFPTLDIDAFSTPTFQKMFGPVVECSVMLSINILERYNVPGRETAIQKLKSVLGKSYNLIIDAIKMQGSEEEKPFVINHGDYWGNNMMFQMDKTTNKIISHVSLDFQITCYNSLGLDVGYYLFTTVNPSVRRAHWKEILEIYLTTFNETVRKLGHPVDLSYEELLLNIRNKINYGFWIGMSLTNEAGIAAFKNINMSELGDMENLSVEFNKQIQKWIDENPEKGKKTAEELVKVLDEYSELLIQ